MWRLGQGIASAHLEFACDGQMGMTGVGVSLHWGLKELGLLHLVHCWVSGVIWAERRRLLCLLRGIRVYHHFIATAAKGRRKRKIQ